MAQSGPLTSHDSIAILPKLEGLGGPTTFQAKLIAGFEKQGIRCHFNPKDPTTRALLVVGGTKHLESIWLARRRGIRVVQRLNGMNWIHKKRNTGWKHFLRAEYGNYNLSTIRKHLSDYIVYQSQFARSWWQTAYGKVNSGASVVYNGVDLDQYNPQGPNQLPEEHIRILLVEGHLAGGYEEGLLNAIRMTEILSQRIPQRIELMVAGDVPEAFRKSIEAETSVWINWAGIVKREQIPMLDRSAHLLFSADLNAACPNSVVEALACGLPSVAFATGSLPELLDHDAGRVAPYGTNYWELEPGDINGLAGAALEVLNNLPYFRKQARAQAEAKFGLDAMVAAYLKALVPEK